MDLSVIKQSIGKIAKKYPVLSIDLFGSYVTGTQTSDSDLDLLVNFDEKKANLFDLSNLKFDIQDELHIAVDIVTGPIKSDSYLIINKKVRIYEC
jgi:hypothetical protein